MQMEYYSAFKRNEAPMCAAARINFESIYFTEWKKSGPKTTCIVRFHRLSERAAAPWEQRQISGCGGLGEEGLGVSARGYRVSFGDVEKSLELDRGGGCTIPCVC